QRRQRLRLHVDARLSHARHRADRHQPYAIHRCKPRSREITMTPSTMWRRGARASIVGTLLTSAGLRAQTPAARFVDSARREIERAVHDMDMDRLDRVGVLLDRALVAFPNDPYVLHYRGYLAYRQAVGWMMMGERTKMAPVIARGLTDLTSAEPLHWPETIEL